MSLRSSALLITLALLAACASAPPAPPAPPQPVVAPRIQAPAALPAHLRELSGSLLGVPAGADVELALLLVDEKDRPGRLLSNATLTGSGAALAFRLSFNPASFPLGGRVELRGRVSQAGRLILRLPSRPILTPESQVLGPLQLERAP
ncbi:MAG TPA: YbaY family lipoprotein [Pseudomonas sp.]|nr:YbaY family lipoprotein [Pseudomonas sp.]